MAAIRLFPLFLLTLVGLFALNVQRASSLQISRLQTHNQNHLEATTQLQAKNPYVPGFCKGRDVFKECSGANRVEALKVDAVKCAVLQFKKVGEAIEPFPGSTKTYWGRIPGAPAPPGGSFAVMGFFEDINAACGDTNCAARGLNRLHLQNEDWNECVNMQWVRCAVSGFMANSPSRQISLQSVVMYVRSVRFYLPNA